MTKCNVVNPYEPFSGYLQEPDLVKAQVAKIVKRLKPQLRASITAIDINNVTFCHFERCFLRKYA